MRECCREYRDVLAVLSELRKAVPAHIAPWVDWLIRFTQENWDAHVDRAGEVAWEGN